MSDDDRADLDKMYATHDRYWDCVDLFENYPAELKKEIIRANWKLIEGWRGISMMTDDDIYHTCNDCGEECQIIGIDDSFDYSGTHCTYGRSGTHRVPVYPGSDCCEADTTEHYQGEEDDE